MATVCVLGLQEPEQAEDGDLEEETESEWGEDESDELIIRNGVSTHGFPYQYHAANSLGFQTPQPAVYISSYRRSVAQRIRFNHASNTFIDAQSYLNSARVLIRDQMHPINVKLQILSMSVEHAMKTLVILVMGFRSNRDESPAQYTHYLTEIADHIRQSHKDPYSPCFDPTNPQEKREIWEIIQLIAGSFETPLYSYNDLRFQHNVDGNPACSNPRFAQMSPAAQLELLERVERLFIVVENARNRWLLITKMIEIRTCLRIKRLG